MIVECDQSGFALDLEHASRDFRQAVAGSSQRFALGLHSGPPRLGYVDFLDGGSIGFRVAARYPTASMLSTLVSRAAAMRVLFARVRLRAPDLTGSCPLWLGDVPDMGSLAFCGNSTSHVLIPDPDFTGSGGYRDRRAQFARHWISFTDRSDTVYWRGALTGNSVRYPVADWRDIPRARLCLHAQRSPRGKFYDVALAGEHVQPRDRAALPEIMRSGIVKSHVAVDEFLQFKYLIDIDGNSSSWSGLFTKLLMGSVVLKVESAHGFRQWYYDRLQPWTNFVPISGDLSDLDEIVVWLQQHPGKAEQIGRAGHELALGITFDEAMDEAVPSITRLVDADPPVTGQWP